MSINPHFEIAEISAFEISIKSVKCMTLFFRSENEKASWLIDLQKCLTHQMTKPRCGCCRSELPLSSLSKCATCFGLVCASCFRIKTDICCLACQDFNKVPLTQRKTSVLGLRGKKSAALPPLSPSSPAQQAKPIAEPTTPEPVENVAVLDCPQGHGLSLIIALQEGYGCDSCGLDMEIGERMQCCVACNYFVCVACQQRPGVTLKLDSTQTEIDAMIEKARTGFLDRFIQGVLEDDDDGSRVASEHSPTAATGRKFSLRDLRQRTLAPPLTGAAPTRSLSPQRIFRR